MRVECLGDFEVGLCGNRFGPFDDNRSAAVTAGDDVDIERNGAEKRHVEVGTHVISPALAEHVGIGATVWARERAHVFDDAEDRHVHRLEHTQSASCDLEADILGCGDDHDA